MKLLHKNILTNTLASLLIIFLGGFITYVFIAENITNESHEHLLIEKKSVEEAIRKGASVNSLQNNIGDVILIEELPKLSGARPYFKQIKQSEGADEKNEEEDGIFEAHSIIFEYAWANKFYQITIIKFFDEDEALGANVLFAVLISAGLMIVIMILANLFIYRKLWNPFYDTLKALQAFNMSKQSKIILPKTGTKEFNYLNRSLAIMTEKNTRDYIALKEFTENASHEIQTPLAIISSKIEMCLQDTKLSDEQAKLLIEASQSINTLANLNKGLIMLAKLDNNQFDELTDVNVYDVFLQRIHIFEEFIQKKEIDVNYKIDKVSVLKMNQLLSEILFDNLIKNAVKHNIQGGKINIEASKDSIKISNTGLEPKGKKERLFDRFYKAGTDDSLGLGLAIVKKICETYGFKISYNYSDGWHNFILRTA